MGQHGEAGGITQKNMTADQAAELMLSKLLQALDVQAGQQLLLMINGVGSTTLMEQYIVLRRCKQILDSRKIKLSRALTGEMLTVQEMAGFQMCIAKMDEELLKLWDAPCNTPALVVR
jgi:dihydroxyacetone kinase-like protein